MSYQTNKDATYARRRYKQRKRDGMCPSCPDKDVRPPEDGYAQCNRCRIGSRAKANKYQRKMYSAVTKLKICGVCKEREAIDGRKWCAVCAERHTEMSKELRAKRRALGLCVRCGSPKPCEKHLALGRIKSALYKKRKRERLAKANAGASQAA